MVEMADPEITSSNPTADTPLNETKPEKICCFPVLRKLHIFIKQVLPPLIWIGGDLADIITLILVAVRHRQDGNATYFALTLFFMFAPSIMFFFMAIIKVIQDPVWSFLGKLGRALFFTLALAGLSLWPLWSYLQMMYYGCKALLENTMSTEHLRQWESINASAQLGTQRVLKVFLQSTPEMILQLYIIMANPPAEQNQLTVITQVVSAVLSLNSMTETVIEFQKEVKSHRQAANYANQQDDDGAQCGEACWTVTEYLWWFCSLAARITAIAFFASAFHYWAITVCAGHAAIMIIFILYRKQHKTLEEFSVTFFMGFIFIFCFMSYKVELGEIGNTILLYFLYYAFVIPQNGVLVLCSYYLNPSPNNFHQPLIIGHFVAMVLAIFFMMCYFKASIKHLRSR